MSDEKEIDQKMNNFFIETIENSRGRSGGGPGEDRGRSVVGAWEKRGRSAGGARERDV